MSRLANRKFPDERRFDQEGNLRVAASAKSWCDLFLAAFNPLREYSSGSACVTIHLLQGIQKIAAETQQPEILSALVEEAERISSVAEQTLPSQSDRTAVQELAQEIGENRVPDYFHDAIPEVALH
jgi:uncharacterized membrane protein